MRNVAIAGLIVIATDPASVFRPSFQLSFAAVVALVGAYESLRNERLRDAGPLAHAWAYGKGVVVTSLVAGAATLLGRPPALGPLNASIAAATVLLVLGLLLLWGGINVWRRSRRRMRRNRGDDLSLSPGLLKKRP